MNSTSSDTSWREFDDVARKYHATPVTLGTLSKYLKAISKTVAEAIRGSNAVVEARIARLDGLLVLYERRITELENTSSTTPAPRWSGEHEHGKGYAAGELCRRKNDVWLCVRDTAASPGMAPGDWELFVKGGQAQP